MKNETMERIRMAGEYQKKAIRALFPERMNEHLDVIEQEVKAMFFEMVADCVRKGNRDDESKDTSPQEKDGKAKKIDIM